MSKALLILIMIVFTLSCYSYGQNNHSPSKKDIYQSLVKEIKLTKDSIYQEYCISNEQERKKQLALVEQYLIQTYYTRLLPAWIGTKWEFYGESEIPGDSSIACGHFVVTTLKHLGINPDQAHAMATDFSTYMVNSLCDTSYTVYKPEELIKIVEQKPDDVWVVGLHNHSGLLVKYNGSLHFVHSSYSYPTAVVDELAYESHTFQHSTIYVAGNLFKSNSLTEKWIQSALVKFHKKK